MNLNVHVHALVLDGVCAPARSGPLRFHAAPVPSATDVAEILAAVVSRVQRLLARHGLDDDGVADPVAEAAPLLAGWAAASVEGLEGDGAARRRTRRLGVSREPSAPAVPVACHARWEGFDLHADVRVPAGHREHLERLCRYVLRPPLAAGRLARTAEGDVAVHLRRPWADGTRQLVFTPRDFLARLAVLVPRPRVNLVLYHGVLAPRAAWRGRVVPRPGAEPVAPSSALADDPVAPSRRGWRWADLMRRVFAADVLACARCGGRLRLVATLEASAITQRILGHLGLPTEVPLPTPPRAPPIVDDWVA